MRPHVPSCPTLCGHGQCSARYACTENVLQFSCTEYFAEVSLSTNVEQAAILWPSSLCFCVSFANNKRLSQTAARQRRAWFLFKNSSYVAKLQCDCLRCVPVRPEHIYIYLGELKRPHNIPPTTLFQAGEILQFTRIYIYIHNYYTYLYIYAHIYMCIYICVYCTCICNMYT